MRRAQAAGLVLLQAFLSFVALGGEPTPDALLLNKVPIAQAIRLLAIRLNQPVTLEVSSHALITADYRNVSPNAALEELAIQAGLTLVGSDKDGYRIISKPSSPSPKEGEESRTNANATLLREKELIARRLLLLRKRQTLLRQDDSPPPAEK